MSDGRNMARLRSGVQSARHLLPALILAAVCSGTTACGSGEPSVEEASARVVASVFPVADLVAFVAGPEISVSTLLGPGSSPATFDPTPRAVRQVERARLVFSVGGGLDAWTAELLEMAPGASSVTLLEGVPLHDDGHGEGTGNPHLWLDPIRTRDVLLPRISDALAGTFPDRAEEVRDRTRSLEDSLTALDAEIRRATSSLPHRAFVASHAAWTYFAERYDLVQVGVIHEHPGQEPSPRDLTGLVRRGREAAVPVVFRESQIADAGARALADELGVPVVSLDPLGGTGVEGRDSYPALMRYNTGQFVLGLGDPRARESSTP